MAAGGRAHPIPAPLLTGRFLFRQYPVIHSVLAPLQPLIELYFGFPLARCGAGGGSSGGTGRSAPLAWVHGAGRTPKQAYMSEHGTKCSCALLASAHSALPPRGVPACSVVIFFALYSGVVNNMSVRCVARGRWAFGVAPCSARLHLIPSRHGRARALQAPLPPLQSIHPTEHAPSHPPGRHVGVSCGGARGAAYLERSGPLHRHVFLAKARAPHP